MYDVSSYLSHVINFCKMFYGYTDNLIKFFMKREKNKIEKEFYYEKFIIHWDTFLRGYKMRNLCDTFCIKGSNFCLEVLDLRQNLFKKKLLVALQH